MSNIFSNGGIIESSVTESSNDYQEIMDFFLARTRRYYNSYGIKEVLHHNSNSIDEIGLKTHYPDE